MIDHISVRVTDIEKSKRLYAAALAPLGYKVIMEFPFACGLGAEGKPDLWLTPSDKVVRTHIAVRAANRGQVDAFHAAALAAGAKDEGAPGLRTQYHPSYYGAFVLDADGNNLEAVTHLPE